MTRPRTFFACSECRQQVAQWVGRCRGCGAWGTIESSGGAAGTVSPVLMLGGPSTVAPRVPPGTQGLDRVRGGGLVPASVVLLAGEPGIGKSTLLLQILAWLADGG